MLKKILKDKILLVVLGLVLISLVLHLINLSWPDWQIFDEIYYFNWGKDYLASRYFFDVHPPLGKLFISLGLFIFNNSLFGARFFQAVIGSFSIYLIYYLANLLFKNKTAGLFAAILFSLETSIFIESRFALINIFIIFFTILSYISFWTYRENAKLKYFYYSLIFASLAISVKWTGASILAVYAIFIIWDSKTRKLFFLNFKKGFKHFLIFLILSLLSFAMPYVLIFSIDYIKGENVVEWHKQAYNFHKNLKGNHPYASKWYTWFLDIRPIWLEFKQTPESYVVGINEVGNPIILWAGTMSIIFNLFWAIVKRNKALLLVLLTIFISTIPWIFISRESFYYHFIPIIPFVILSLTYMMYVMYVRWKLYFVSIGIIVFALTFFVWYWPLLNGILIPYQGYNERVIFSSWR